MPAPDDCQYCAYWRAIWGQSAVCRVVACTCTYDLLYRNWSHVDSFSGGEPPPFYVTPPDWCPRREEAGN